MKIKLAQELGYFRNSLQKLADPKRAEGEKRYLKSSLRHYGVSMPKLEKIIRVWAEGHPECSIDDAVKLSNLLWDSQWHEEKTIAVELLAYKAQNLEMRHLKIIEKMMREAKTWAHIDPIAILLIGSIMEKDKKMLKRLPEWAEDDNFWVRRIAILSQVLQFRKGKGNFTLFKKIVIPMLREGADWSKEERFFIRKAIGWALRELAPRRPELVYDFLKTYHHQMSGLTFKEGSRKLPLELQKNLKNNS